MHFHFGQLIAHLAKTRHLRAGSVIGSGTVSNTDAAKGFACIAEKRAVETLQRGAPISPFLVPGDRIRIEIKGRDGLSVFGAIEQTVTGPQLLALSGSDGFADAGEPAEPAEQPNDPTADA